MIGEKFVNDLTKRSALVAASVVLAVSLAGTGSVSSAQTGGPVASGEFRGVIAVNGGFSVDPSKFAADVGGSLAVLVNGNGPLELTLADGAMTGTWSIGGTQALDGTFTSSAGGVTSNVVVTGGGTFSGSGQLSGPPGDYSLAGSITSTNTATVDVSGFSQSATTTETTPIQQTLTDVVVLCQQIYGRWDLEIRQQIDAIGFDEFIRGYFSASTGVDATDQAEEIQRFLTEASGWAQSVGDVTADDRSLFIGRALSILDAVEGFQAELAAPSPCPPDPAFATELTLAAQDTLARLIAQLPGITNSRIVVVALRSGAIGAGSPVPAAAAALQAQLEADVQQQWEADVAGYPGTTTDAELLETARTAQLLGMDSIGEVTPADVILVLGATP
jgi:hypothetical protein